MLALLVALLPFAALIGPLCWMARRAADTG
jgi:uncharacterized Tic20 family protein